MRHRLHREASGDLLGFAEDVRDRVGGVDREAGAWIEAGLGAADAFPPTLGALEDLGLREARAVAVGKAAVPMAAAWQAFGGAPGLAVVPHDAHVASSLSSWRVIRGEHPAPGDGSFEAGRAVLEVASSGEDVMLLLSGGASAMMEAPLVPRGRYEEFSHRLRRMGLPIATWNAARALLSRLKAGALAGVVQGAGAALHTLYVSDVPGDEAHVVGSGPGVRQELARLEGMVERIEPGVRDALLEAGQLRPVSADAASTRCVLARGEPARRLAQVVSDDGKEPRVLDPLDEEGHAAAARVAAAVEAAARDEVVVVWGEPLVKVPAHAGPGGRTTVLLAHLWSCGARKDAFGVMVGTDGVDGPSGLGGCFARLGDAQRDDARRALDGWSTASFFSSLPRSVGGGVPARSTGTNCADLGVVRP